MAELTKEQIKFHQDFQRLKPAKRKEVYLKVLEDALGNVSVATKTCGITRQSHYDWIQKYPKFAEAVEAIQDVAIDFVEGSLMRNIKEGKETSIIFYLKTKGKKRGYIETVHTINQEVEDSISDMTDEELEQLLK